MQERSCFVGGKVQGAKALVKGDGDFSTSAGSVWEGREARQVLRALTTMRMTKLLTG